MANQLKALPQHGKKGRRVAEQWLSEATQISLRNVSISHDLLSDNTANERFPRLQEEDLANLRGKNQNQNTPKSTKTWLNVFSEWKGQRYEGKKFEDIPRNELDGIICRFFAEIRKKEGDEYEPENLAVMQCSLDRH